MEKKKKLIILGIITLTLVIIGTTYAILTWTSSKINLGLNSGCFTIDYTKGQDISGNLKLLNESDLISNNKFTIKNGIGISAVNIGINSTCTIEGYGSIYLNVTNISDAFTAGDSKGALKYAVLSNTSTITTPSSVTVDSLLNQSFDIVSTGSITSNDTITLLTKQLSNTEVYKYLVVIYVDNALAGNSITSASFSGNISADANQGKVPYVGLAKDIQDLYVNADKTIVTNNNINYEYDTTNNLMQDVSGNIRYYGATPNNYIYFNCSDYANQSSSTCELWRIIGVFDGKVKLVRDTSIGDYSWNNKDTTTGAETDYGKNDWTDARLMKLLNPGYDSETIGGSLYYNAKSGTCYKEQKNATVDCNFTSIGIKNNATRNLIQEVIYNLGGWNPRAVYPDFIYEKERDTTVYSGRPTTWTGKIGLMYPSDYGYAADFTKCKDASGNDLNIGSYASDVNDYQCRKNNYLYKGTAEFLLTPNSGDSLSVWFVSSPGGVYDYGSACYSSGVRPVLSLNSELSSKSGTGSSTEPYQLAV